MPSEALFNATVIMLEKLLDFHSDRHKLLSTNIANIDTPGYKGYDIRFSDELKKAVSTKGNMPLRRTSEKHLPGGIGELREVKHDLVASSGTAYRLDGNTVDLDKEMTKLAENSLYYDTAAQVISKKLRGIKTAISGVS